MGKRDKKNILYAIGVASLLVIAYYSRAFHTQVDEPIIKMLLVMIRSVIQISLVIGWCSSVGTRIINKQVRHYLIAVGILLAFWLILRTCKWEFIAQNGTHLGRYLWYAYYIPMVFVPLLGVFIIDHIGKAENYNTPRRMKYLYIPAVLLVLSVFTNDLHQLVFSFPNGIEYGESDYNYQALYYITMAWFILLGIYFVVMLIKKSRVPSSKSFQKLPAVILGISIIFWVLYCMQIVSGDLAAIDCIMIISLLESAIQSGLIPSNTSYNELFRSSTVSAQIVDTNYQPCMVSGTATALTEDVMKSAKAEPVDLGDTILHSKKITGGYVLWQDDVKQIKELIKELRYTRERLGESNELLKAELELKENRAGTKEKNRLYDRIAKEVAPQLAKAEELLKLAESEPKQTKSVIAKVSVICAYIKRRGNLLLLEEENNIIPARELEYCIRESLDNLRLGNIFTSFDSKCDGELKLELAVVAFDFYENIVERLLDDATAILIHLDCKDGIIKMRLQIGCNKDIAQHTLSELSVHCGNFEWNIQDEDVTVTLLVSEGGGDK
ncbi:MAG: hypothetical protein MSH11_01760 [Ruminococcus sp.]|nr:hypothetical protein [Ruminococcus sp.]